MIQLMRNNTLKMEVDDDDQQHEHKHKRPKLDHHIDEPFSASSSKDDSSLDEPSPLGLRLRKSPSLMDLIQMKLSHNTTNSTMDSNKLKASNFPATILKIGTWEYKSRYEGDLVAKCYFAKHKLVWEVLDGCLKNKIEISWSDILHLKANYPEDGPGTLQIVLARRPLFFREIDPQPRKHTLWQTTSDFTGGQASIHRRHFLQCAQGLLGKHFEKLIQRDHRLNILSQQPDFVLDCPYFEQRTTIDGQMESSDGFDRKSQEQAGFFGSQDVQSGAAVQSSSSKSEHNLSGKDVESVSQEINSPSSVMGTHEIEGFKRRGGAETLRFQSNLDQTKLAGLEPSMSMNDITSHIEHYISEHMASSNPSSSGDIQHCRSIMEEFSQHLFNDCQLTTTDSETQFVMSRVNSLSCLLQKVPSTSEEDTIKLGTSNGVDGEEAEDGGKAVGESNSGQVVSSSCKSIMNVNSESEEKDDDGCGCKQGNESISRKESGGDLLLNLPRIASLPKFLVPMSDDYVNQVR